MLLQNERISHDGELRDASEEQDRTDSVTQRLVAQLQSLPDCHNMRCDQEMPSLQLKRKGHPRLGAGEGDWVVRCHCGSELK